MEVLTVRLYLNRKAWRPRHWVVLVACVAGAKLADVAADHGWWSWVTVVLMMILLSLLPRDFVGLKRRKLVPKDRENGWEVLLLALASGLVSLVLTALTFGDYSDTSELRAHGVIATTPGTVTARDKNDNQDIEVAFTTKNGSRATGTVSHPLEPRPAVGDQIAVRYSPTDPELIAVASYPLGYGHVVFGGVLSALVWTLMAFSLRLEYRTRG